MTTDQLNIIHALDDVTAILGVVSGFLVILTLGAYLVLFRNDEQKRAKAMKSSMLPIIGFIVLGFGVQITTMIYDLMVAMTAHVNPSGHHGGGGGDLFKKITEEPGVAARLLYGTGDVMFDGIHMLREKLYGTDLGIKKIIFSAEANPLVNLNVTVSGISVNLYRLMMSLCAAIIFLMVARTGLKIMYAAVDDKQGAELREALYRWVKIPVLVMVAPLFFLSLTKMVTAMLGAIDGITIGSESIDYLDIYGLPSSEYGFGVLVAKFYLLYVEFRIWLMMFFRKIVINTMFVITPLAITLSGHPDEFDAFNVILATMIKFLFYPFYYGLAYYIIVLVLGAMATGSNVIVMIIGFGFLFSLVDVLLLVFTVKRTARQDHSGSVGRGATMMGATMVAATALSRSMRTGIGVKNGGSKVSSAIGTTNNLAMRSAMMAGAKTTATSFAKQAASNVGVNAGMICKVGGGMKAAGKVAGKGGRLAGAVAGNKGVRAASSIGAAMAVTALTGNVGAGLLAGGNLNALQKGIGQKVASVAATEEAGKLGLMKAEQGLVDARRAYEIEEVIAGQNGRDTGNLRGLHKAEVALNQATSNLSAFGPATASSDLKNHKRR